MIEEPLTNKKSPFDLVSGRESNIGPFVGILAILAILVVGAWYFGSEQAGQKSSSKIATTTTIVIHRYIPPTATTTATGNAELDAIQNSLRDQSTNLNNLSF
ncbi:MAG: hypothetical protein KGJ35_00400 [Patescibacteria group bacterium]|nr:hypothetical protein [Patescibacteria group bacterium]